MDTTSFPFSAVLGMDDAKKAIMCALVNPKIKCVLIKGRSGVAKSTIARSVRGICEKSIVNVPLNVANEQLFGGMDIESALKTGSPALKKGILGRADGNLIYFDDVNLADDTLTMSLLDSILCGRVIIEREGISSSYSVDAALIATMNPEEKEMSDHIMDRFDICANSSGEERKDEVLRRNMSYSDDPSLFCQSYSEEEEEIKNKIKRAKRILPTVRISDDLIQIIVELCGKIGAAGHRGDISVANTAMTLAALNDRDEVIKKDVEEAAILCLSHRRNYSPPPPPPEEDEKEEEEQDQEEEKEDEKEQNDDKNEPEEDWDEPEKDDKQDEPPPNMEGMLDEMLFEIGEQFKVIDFLGQGDKKRIKKTKSRMGRRETVESCDSTGRYSGYRMPRERVSDVALDATIREAATHQRSREKGSMAINIEESDLREKVRERRSGCTIMFVVDASGSIGVRKRMVAVKGAILSMLRESYVKRDRVGMMAFRRSSTEVILPPTKSVEYSHRKLEELPTGGKTPLGNALTEAGCYMATYSKHHPGESCYVVLLTDGRANVPMESGSDAISEAQEIAEKIKIHGVKWIVIDVASGFKRFNHAKELAMKLEGTYFRLDDLNAENLSAGVKALIS
jgi:magnesium chelatase subunit D